MALLKNMVYEWVDPSATMPAVERLLWLDSSVSYVWAINIYHPKAQPVRREIAELEAAFETGEARVLEKDPFDYLIQPEEAFKVSHRQRRDRSWVIIQSLVERGDPPIFHFYARNSPSMKLIATRGYNKKNVYKLLRRFFQRGQIINALLPLYDNCGWRDRSRPKKSNSKSEKTKARTEPKKLGRPSKLSLAEATPLGVNVTKEMDQVFQSGIRLFYEKRLRAPLKRAYQLTLEQFFNCGYAKNRNGVWVPQLPPTSEMPSYHQFKYWYKKTRSPSKAHIAREGQIRHNLSGRAKLGDSTQMAAGPGSIFQVDATLGDVYLVSSLNRLWIIGRPVIYFIIDVFSRLVTGLSVSLEGPSWLGAKRCQR